MFSGLAIASHGSANWSTRGVGGIGAASSSGFGGLAGPSNFGGLGGSSGAGSSQVSLFRLINQEEPKLLIIDLYPFVCVC